MVNLNPPQFPEMQEIDGIQVHPDDVEKVKARQARKRVTEALGAQAPVSVVGVPVGTDNRRQTAAELYDGEPSAPATPARVRLDGAVGCAPPAAANDSGTDAPDGESADGDSGTTPPDDSGTTPPASSSRKAAGRK